MQHPTSKELYMMNGGQKMYIGRDGFADVYKATPEEEAAWAKELIANYLDKIAREKNRVQLQFAVAGLAYHQYENLEELLLKHTGDTNPIRQIVFASSLWTMFDYEKGFEILIENLVHKRTECLGDVFLGLNDFKQHPGAGKLLISCLEGNDEVLATKAQNSIAGWAWTGLPALRDDELLNQLKFENRNQPLFKPAIEKLRQILNFKK